MASSASNSGLTTRDAPGDTPPPRSDQAEMINSAEFASSAQFLKWRAGVGMVEVSKADTGLLVGYRAVLGLLEGLAGVGLPRGLVNDTSIDAWIPPPQRSSLEALRALNPSSKPMSAEDEDEFQWSLTHILSTHAEITRLRALDGSRLPPPDSCWRTPVDSLIRLAFVGCDERPRFDWCTEVAVETAYSKYGEASTASSTHGASEDEEGTVKDGERPAVSKPRVSQPRVSHPGVSYPGQFFQIDTFVFLHIPLDDPGTCSEYSILRNKSPRTGIQLAALPTEYGRSAASEKQVKNHLQFALISGLSQYHVFFGPNSTPVLCGLYSEQGRVSVLASWWDGDHSQMGLLERPREFDLGKIEDVVRFWCFLRGRQREMLDYDMVRPKGKMRSTAWRQAERLERPAVAPVVVPDCGIDILAWLDTTLQFKDSWNPRKKVVSDL